MTNEPNVVRVHVADSMMPGVEHALLLEQLLPTSVLPQSTFQAEVLNVAPSVLRNSGDRMLIHFTGGQSNTPLSQLPPALHFAVYVPSPRHAAPVQFFPLSVPPHANCHVKSDSSAWGGTLVAGVPTQNGEEGGAGSPAANAKQEHQLLQQQHALKRRLGSV
jgi:hypothetical protein